MMVLKPILCDCSMKENHYYPLCFILMHGIDHVSKRQPHNITFVDGATCLEWLSIDGVAVGSIDVGVDSRYGLAVWRKKGDLFSCALVSLVAWVVPFASPVMVMVGLLKLGWCGFGALV